MPNPNPKEPPKPWNDKTKTKPIADDIKNKNIDSASTKMKDLIKDKNEDDKQAIRNAIYDDLMDYIPCDFAMKILLHKSLDHILIFQEDGTIKKVDNAIEVFKCLKRALEMYV